MIILLNGSINAGKTTVSQQIVKMLPRTAHVEVDHLDDFIDWMPLLDSIPLNLANAAAVTRNFVAFGLNVIISTPLRRQDYDWLRRELQPLGIPVHCITLSPSMAIALTNRGTRELTAWELGRIPELYAEGIHSPPSGIIIDNAHQTPEETAYGIVEMVNNENTQLERQCPAE